MRSLGAELAASVSNRPSLPAAAVPSTVQLTLSLFSCATTAGGALGKADPEGAVHFAQGSPRFGPTLFQGGVVKRGGPGQRKVVEADRRNREHRKGFSQPKVQPANRAATLLSLRRCPAFVWDSSEKGCCRTLLYRDIDPPRHHYTVLSEWHKAFRTDEATDRRGLSDKSKNPNARPWFGPCPGWCLSAQRATNSSLGIAKTPNRSRSRPSLLLLVLYSFDSAQPSSQA